MLYLKFIILCEYFSNFILVLNEKFDFPDLSVLTFIHFTKVQLSSPLNIDKKFELILKNETGYEIFQF
mgnify:CR=1 FL=1